MSEQDKITEITGETVSVSKKQEHFEEMPMLPYDPQYANAYVPYQQYNGIMKPEKALICGTAFAELSMPYGGWKTRL